MQLIYNILLPVAAFFLRLLSVFNPKIKLGVVGRRNTFKILSAALSGSESNLWFHCASLGEYEQGVPVFEKVKALFPNKKVVLSFISPSGYEIRKDTSLADAVVYLPLDTKRNAKRFLDLVNPDFTIFVKYEIWPNHLNELMRRNKKAILISALLRKSQVYFKPTGRFMLSSLNAFDHIFVQNESSKNLLNEYGFDFVSVSGDTRFDRVSEQLLADNTIPLVEQFKQDKLCIIAGSTWPEGEKALADYINSSSNAVKYIIAPHTIRPKQIEELKLSIDEKTVLYTETNAEDVQDAKVLILNTIGMLAKAYVYANIAYVGGALGTTGLHNILEPAVFGVPVIIGPNHERYPEAHEMKAEGALFVVSNLSELKSCLDKLISDEDFRNASGHKNKVFVKKNAGAVVQIMSFLRKYAV